MALRGSLINRHSLKACAAWLVLTGAAFSQASFEVASIRPNTSGDGASYSSSSNGRFIGRNLSLRDLIQRAYGVMPFQIIGPDWLRSGKFDVMAKPPAGSYGKEFESMMQMLLAERFKLQLHREQREFSVYAMVPAKSGIKAVKVADDGNAQSNNSRGRISAKHMSMAGFAERLSRFTDRPVVDGTGITGAFDFELNWTPDGDRPKPADAPTPTSDEPPSLFTAIEEQLGLKLEPKKAPIEVLVIDHAEKVPTEN